MGIDYCATIIVGLSNEELTDVENLEELLDEEQLECCAPYYDGNDDDNAIIGIYYEITSSYTPKEIKWDQTVIDKMKAEFKEITGKNAQVWLSPFGY